MKKLSCGILLLNPQAELLLCHATGQATWDLPKGGGEPGETPLHTAVRETEEETGLLVPEAALTDLGRQPYTARKDLHLFALLVQPVDTAHCVCRSLFRSPHGVLLPEMDAFAWVPFDGIASRCRPAMTALLTRGIDVHGLWRRLMDAGQPQALAWSANRSPRLESS